MTEEKTWANISRFQTYLFNSGDNFKSYEMLGSHKVKIDGVDGWRFAVWAPKAVSVRAVSYTHLEYIETKSEVNMEYNEQKQERVILAGVHRGMRDALWDTTEESIHELGELVKTAGGIVVGEMIQNKADLESAT